MRFEILNVEHGFAAYAIAADGAVLLFDCGLSNAVQPSAYLAQQGIGAIEILFVMNYDQDHVGDLPTLRKNFGIHYLACNRSVSVSQLEIMKSPVTHAMREVIDMRRTYIGPDNSQHQGIDFEFFYNSYPQFQDSNNLSLLVFMKMGELFFALSGDLERAGWKALLLNPRVCELLQAVNVFVHHIMGAKTDIARRSSTIADPM